MSDQSPSPGKPADENPYAPPSVPTIEPQRTDATQWLAGQQPQGLSPRQIQAQIRQRIGRREPIGMIRSDALQAGLSAADADGFIRIEIAAHRRKTFIPLALGAVFTVVGILATLASYAEAGRHQGQFMIWFGPVIFGLVLLLVGMVRLAR